MCGALVVPLRLLGAFALATGLAFAGSKDSATAVALLVSGLVLLVTARVLRDIRWPALPRYLRDPSHQGQPGDWHPDDQRSDSGAVWSVVRAVIEPWIRARRNPLQRSMTRREALHALGGTASEQRPFDKVSLPELVGPADALSRRLSPDELAAARNTGVLPPWFWDELAAVVTRR